MPDVYVRSSLYLEDRRLRIIHVKFDGSTSSQTSTTPELCLPEAYGSSLYEIRAVPTGDTNTITQNDMSGFVSCDFVRNLTSELLIQDGSPSGNYSSSVSLAVTVRKISNPVDAVSGTVVLNNGIAVINNGPGSSEATAIVYSSSYTGTGYAQLSIITDLVGGNAVFRIYDFKTGASQTIIDTYAPGTASGTTDIQVQQGTTTGVPAGLNVYYTTKTNTPSSATVVLIRSANTPSTASVAFKVTLFSKTTGLPIWFNWYKFIVSNLASSPDGSSGNPYIYLNEYDGADTDIGDSWVSMTIRSNILRVTGKIVSPTTPENEYLLDPEAVWIAGTPNLSNYRLKTTLVSFQQQPGTGGTPTYSLEYNANPTMTNNTQVASVYSGGGGTSEGTMRFRVTITQASNGAVVYDKYFQFTARSTN